MKRRVLDTNVLVTLWHSGSGRVDSERAAEAVAHGWLAEHPRDAIVTPVRLEFLGGTRSRDELRVAEGFLGLFDLLDGGRVLPEDWHVAERYAKRVPFAPRPRGAIDCLILAICVRLNASLYTFDGGISRDRGSV